MSSISDALIELLRFTKADLRELAKASDPPVVLPGGAARFVTAEALARQMSLDTIRDIAGEHLGAGKTSIAWVALLLTDNQPVAADGKLAVEDPDDAEFAGEALTSKQVETALAKLTGKTNPFTANIRPKEVTSEPALVKVQRDEGDYLLTFAVRTTSRVVIRNFELRRVPEDVFFHAVLRPAEGVLEVRAGYVLAGKLTKGWAETFAEAVGRRAQRLFITESDLPALCRELGAYGDRYDGRDESGTSDFHRQTMTRADHVQDLFKSKEFLARTAGDAMNSSDILFDYGNPGEEEEVRLRVSTKQGTVQFLTSTSNDVIAHVYAAVRRARA